MSKVKQMLLRRNLIVLLIAAVILVSAVIWWQQQLRRQPATQTESAANAEQARQTSTATQEPSPQLQPAPASHGTTPEGAVEQEAKDHWDGPMTRDQDKYGPPPGWVAPTPYGPEGHQPATTPEQEQATPKTDAAPAVTPTKQETN